jgi:alkanesulfonate monooxygenase SsuD/methylene tetrahydromethanopterin reductase-like flavin-dependent oxidoreductase (luciferase family)
VEGRGRGVGRRPCRIQIVGSPATPVAQLRRLREATGADELAVTTIAHDPADRLRSYELPAAG